MRPCLSTRCGVLVAMFVTAPCLPAQPASWSPDERVLITDFGQVTALVRSPRQVFVATTGGLLVLEEISDRWDLPLTVEDGYPDARVTALVYDHRDGSVWMSAAGDLIQLDPSARRFVNRVPIGRPAQELVPAEDSGDDLFLRVFDEWWRVDTFTRDLRRADPMAVSRSIEARHDLRARRDALLDPFFRDGVASVARARDGRRLVVTDVTPAREPSIWWVGTAGDWLLEYDHVARQARGWSYGPIGERMAAVAVDDGDVWFAPARLQEGRYALARASTDLGEWSVWRADSSRSVPVEVRAMLATPDGVWAGGAEGLHWLDRGSGEWRPQRGIGVATHPVHALSPATGVANAVWVGTERGLFRVPSPGSRADLEILSGERIRTVVEGADAVWIGTGRGLFRAAGRDPAGTVDRVTGPAALRDRVSGLAVAGDTVFVGVGMEVWWKPGLAREWERLDPVGRARGEITAIALDRGVLWVGSTEELTVWDAPAGAIGRYAFGRDLPPGRVGETGIWSIAPVSEREAWLALPSGALRLSTGF